MIMDNYKLEKDKIVYYFCSDVYRRLWCVLINNMRNYLSVWLYSGLNLTINCWKKLRNAGWEIKTDNGMFILQSVQTGFGPLLVLHSIGTADRV
jgi:hypothetical protein